MVQTQTISTSPIFSHFLQRLYLNASKKTILDYEPAEVVDIALQKLQKAGVELIEWRSLLYRRMNVPVILKVNLNTSSLLHFSSSNVIQPGLFLCHSGSPFGRCLRDSFRYGSSHCVPFQASPEDRGRLSGERSFPSDHSLDFTLVCPTSSNLSSFVFYSFAIGTR